MKQVLDKDFYLTPDSYSGVILNKIVKGENKKGEPIETIDKWYYPNYVFALEKYAKLKQEQIAELDQMLEIYKETLNVIKDYEYRRVKK